MASKKETLIGFASSDTKIKFNKRTAMSKQKINEENESDRDDDDILLPMQGFDPNQNYKKDEKVKLVGKILQYDATKRTYSIELTASSNTISSPFKIQIPEEYIHSIDSNTNEQNPDASLFGTNYENEEKISYFDDCIKDTKNQNETINEEDNSFHRIRNNLKCILSMYASDANNIEIDEKLAPIQQYYHNVYASSRPIGDICDEMFRISPFGDNKVLTNNTNPEIASCKQTIGYDENNHIYYYHLGDPNSKPPNQILFTPKLKWPHEKYSVAIWVHWKNDYFTIRGKMDSLQTILTTFDSENNAPIWVDNRGHIGCHSINGKSVLMHINGMVDVGWNFVIALGSRNESKFYLGTLKESPKYIGSIRDSICGQETVRIGERNQGPGLIGFVSVFEGHLNEIEMKTLYHESISEMAGTWNMKQMKGVKVVLSSHCGNIESVMQCIIEFAKLTNFC